MGSIVSNFRSFYDFKKTYGIACFFDQQGGVKLDLSYLERHGDTIDLLDNHCFAEWDPLFSFLEKRGGVPIALQLQGRGILIKETSLATTDKDDLLKILPNYSEDDFLHSIFLGNGTNWICFVKRTLILELVHRFKKAGFVICQLYLGPFVVENVLDQLNGYSGIYNFNGHTIRKDLEKNLWDFYLYKIDEQAKFKIKLGSSEIKEQFVVSYACAFSLMMFHYLQDLSINEESVEESFSNERAKLQFRTNGAFALGSILVLLLINITLYISYKGKYERLDILHQEHFSNQNELELLSEKTFEQDSLLLTLGWNGGIPKAWILAKIAESLSGRDKIFLTGLVINPESDKGLATSSINEPNLNKITLTGECSTLGQLESWLRFIRNSEWISEVEVISFVDNNVPNNSSKQFVVNFEFKHEF
ncbi:PilN domain-containing protein [Sphingobacterium hotanense]|uniref:PilN domain-containing protein n=1 Tax=Sphingobacterium hotanense TaxID=649196 RepID=UPI0021A6115B|nr:PilN domain-containing protein [Sphingobacterium hotanense]MCT1526457.1 PilN domain-containing protein [Sphingobacterium hotanense]